MNSSLSRGIVLTALMVSMGACAQEATDVTIETAAEAEVDAAEEAISESAIMAVALDGSSTEAFEAGLAKVEAEATAKEFHLLQGALSEYVLYDMSSRGKVENIYPKLNGKTPREIIDGSPKRNR